MRRETPTRWPSAPPTYLGVGRITEVEIIIAIIDSYRREREIHRSTGTDES
jgi:hypothetical protein